MSEQTPKVPQQRQSVKETEGASQDLTVEELDSVLQKVQDINADGTAFTSVYKRDLPKILREGLLSGGGQNAREWALSTKEIRKKVMRDERYEDRDEWEKQGVFINIVGRKEVEGKRKWYPEAKTTTIQDVWGDRSDKVNLLVDISAYKEIPPFTFYFETKPMEARTFKATDVIDYKDWKQAFGDRPESEYHKVTWDELKEKIPRVFDEQGKPRIKDSAFGFYVGYNIPAKLIRGVVVDYTRISSDSIIKGIINTYSRGHGTLIPVYGHDGRLVWPQPMSYDNVKKYIAAHKRAAGTKDSETDAFNKPLEWKIEKIDDQNWKISSQVGNDSAYVLFDTDTIPDGLYISQFDNEILDRQLSRADLVALLDTILACLNNTGKNKLYSHPGVRSVDTIFDTLGAEKIAQKNPDGEPEDDVLRIATHEQITQLVERLKQRKRNAKADESP